MKPILAFSLCLILSALPVQGQDSACPDLRNLYEVHSDALLAYLNDVGESCLNPPPTPAASSGTVALWSHDVTNRLVPRTSNLYSIEERVLVDLRLLPGIYKLSFDGIDLSDDDIIRSNQKLEDIVQIPDRCFSTFPRMYLPSLVQITEDCQIFATYDGFLSSSVTKTWTVSISEHVPEVVAATASDWSIGGQGSHQSFVDLIFEPGIYRINIDFGSGDIDVEFKDIIDIPNRCFPTLRQELPTQVHIEQTCTFSALLHVAVDDDRQNQAWKTLIRKLH